MEWFDSPETQRGEFLLILRKMSNPQRGVLWSVLIDKEITESLIVCPVPPPADHLLNDKIQTKTVY